MIGKLHNSIAVSAALLLIFCGNASAVYAPGSIEGTVVDKDTGLPIVYCRVVIIGTGMGGVTKADGSYRIDGIPPGPYSVRAKMMVYEADERCRVDVEAGETINIFFELEPLSSAEIAEIRRSAAFGGCCDGCILHKIPSYSYESLKLPVVDPASISIEEYEEARLELFPCGAAYILDDCLIQSADSAWSKGCPECMRQAKIWRSK